MAQYYHCACIHASSGFFNPFHCLRASLANFFLLGHPQPISFPWASSAHSNSAFLWVFAKSFGLSRPNYYILHLWGLWVFHQPFTHLIHCFEPLCPILTCFLSHIMPMSLLLLPLGFSRLVASFDAHLLFFRPMIYYSCHSGLMVFLLIY